MSQTVPVTVCGTDFWAYAAAWADYATSLARALEHVSRDGWAHELAATVRVSASVGADQAVTIEPDEGDQRRLLIAAAEQVRRGVAGHDALLEIADLITSLLAGTHTPAPPYHRWLVGTGQAGATVRMQIP